MNAAERAAGCHEVLAECSHWAPVHKTSACDNAVGRQHLLFHAEIVAGVRRMHSELLEGVRLKQRIEPVACCHQPLGPTRILLLLARAVEDELPALLQIFK